MAFVRARIESYADYTNDDARRLADEQIRAYVGEALGRVGERLRPGGAVAEALERVLLRCQFADQSVVRAFDIHDLTAAEVAALHAVDRELIGLADRADTVAVAALDGYVARIDETLDRRALIVTGPAFTTPQPPVR